jgi:cupin superfamily acireductone dioxygenase involved in methionine salvage
MKTIKDLIFPLENIPLSTVPHHSDVEGIERYFSEVFPVHMAVHDFNRKDSILEKYTSLHQHDVAEINIILGSDDVQYRIGLEDEEFIVGRNTGIWIPAGIRHSANLITGIGYYIAIRLDMHLTDKARTIANCLSTLHALS